MSAGKRLVRFGSGSMLGAGLGAAVAIIFAPDSGDDLRHRLRDRLRRAKLAGARAQAAKTSELVGRFRQTVDDPDALAETEADARQRLAIAVSLEPAASPAAPPSALDG